MSQYGRMKSPKLNLIRTESCKNQTYARSHQIKLTILHRSDNNALFHWLMTDQTWFYTMCGEGEEVDKRTWLLGYIGDISEIQIEDFLGFIKGLKLIYNRNTWTTYTFWMTRSFHSFSLFSNLTFFSPFFLPFIFSMDRSLQMISQRRYNIIAPLFTTYPNLADWL